MWKFLTRLASPGGSRGRLSVLFFHRVVGERDLLLPDEPTAKEFDQMMAWLQKQFNVIPLSEGIKRLADGTLPPAAAAITFDDGYRDNLEIAAPILKQRGLPATLFVATGFIDGGIMFNDMVIEALRHTSVMAIHLPELGIERLPLISWENRRNAVNVVLPAIKHLPFSDRLIQVEKLVTECKVALPLDMMMTTSQLRNFVGMGFEIGAHTDNHPILRVLPDDLALDEITRGRTKLESMINANVSLFAYPNGRWGMDFDQRHCDMAKACGFEAAFSTEAGVCTPLSNFWNLPRFTPWDRKALHFHARMLLNQRRTAEQPLV